MSRVPGCPLSQLRAGSLVRSEVVYETCLQILVRLAEHGLVHCDLNEFDLTPPQPPLQSSWTRSR